MSIWIWVSEIASLINEHPHQSRYKTFSNIIQRHQHLRPFPTNITATPEFKSRAKPFAYRHRVRAGLEGEVRALDMFNAGPNHHVYKRYIVPFKYGFEGKPDGWKNGNPVEVKTRTQASFRIPFYDTIQIHAYMQLLQKPCGYFVQLHKQSFHSTMIPKDDNLWDTYILPRLLPIGNLLHHTIYHAYESWTSTINKHEWIRQRIQD